MAENYKLSLTAEEIDERLANALLATEQTLNEAQQAQVRSNIGAAGCLPKVTLTTVATVDADLLSAEEAAAVAAAAENGVFFLECTAQVEEVAFVLCGIVTALYLPDGEHGLYELRAFEGDHDVIVRIVKQPDGAGDFVWGVFAALR